MRRVSLWLALSAVVVLVATPGRARAQNLTLPAPTDSIPTVADTASPAAPEAELAPRPASEAGASRLGLRAGVHSPVEAPSMRPLIAPNRAGLGQSRAMMIVGGAAVIVGAVIGGTPGTLFMVGGAVVGLIGLYEYLQ